MAEIILGIESSCDDTSAAVIKDGWLLSNVLASQDVHKAYGGVIPELASRAHQVNIVPVVSEAITRAGIKPEDIASPEDIRKLPFTTKQDLRDTYPFGLAAVPLSDCVRLHSSSGTTGNPTVILHTQTTLTSGPIRWLVTFGW